MNNSKHWLFQLFFVIFFSITVSVASAGDDVEAVSAGDDQTVNAGDLVNLTGVITFEEDDEDEHKHRHDHKKHKKHKKRKKYKEYKKRHKHGHKRGHEKDDDEEEEIVIAWSQTAGTTVVVDGANTLTPSFTVPADISADETLSFLLTISDDDGDVEASDVVDVTVIAAQPVISTVSGRVTAVDGSVIAGANVNVLAAGALLTTVSSDATGNFAVVLDANSDAVLQLSAVGYADQVVPVRSPTADGNVFFGITMIARGATQSFDAAVGGTLAGSDGASVTVSADSFVDANGTPVVGNIDLTITPVDVSSPASLAAFPGEFSGVLEGDVTDTPIISFGTVEFEFTSGGQPVNLAPGQTANVIIPMYFDTYQDGTSVALGDTIPLWSLNEDTGIWQQEGVGTVIASADSPTGFAMDAVVTHFSWWNCDVSSNAAQAVVTVFGPEAGTALIRARTNANIGWRPDTVDTVSEVGTPTSPLFIPSNGEVCFWAEISYNSGATGITPEFCVNAAPNALVNVDLTAAGAGPVNIITSPADTAGVLDVVGYLNFPIDRVQIQPSTLETVVNYTIVSGALPAGMSLNTINATRAEIVGVPTEAGLFSVVVEGVDVDGNVDAVTINYDVTTDVPPPILEGFVNIYTSGGGAIDTYEAATHNVGGTVTSWALTYKISFEQSPPPTGVSINSNGTITIVDDLLPPGFCWWNGFVEASNSAGMSEIQVQIIHNSCLG